MPLTIEGRLQPNAEQSTASLAEHVVEAFFRRRVTVNANEAPRAGEQADTLRAQEAGGVEELPDSEPPEPHDHLLDRVRGWLSGELTKGREPERREGTIEIAARAVGLTDDAGAFRLTITEDEELVDGPIRLVASAPSGSRIGSMTVAVADLAKHLTIAVDAIDRAALDQTEPEPDPTPTVHLSWKLSVPTGKPLPAGLPVTVTARRADAGNGDGDQPILVTRLDGSGAFFGDVVNDRYTEASATVPGAAAPIPVPLQAGRLPTQLLLSAELEDTTAPDATDQCDCRDGTTPPRLAGHVDIYNAPETYSVDLGTGKCVDFTTPNRAIEEFDFYSVVRTTQPEIRPHTLADADRTPSANGSPTRDANKPLIAASYDIELEARETDPGGITRISFATADGRRLVVFQMGDLRFVGFPPSGGSATALPVVTRHDTYSVTENRDYVDAIGLDLRLIREVQVEWDGTRSNTGFALDGIGIAATTTDGEVVPILIQGSTFYTAEPYVDLFQPSGGDTHMWKSQASIERPVARMRVATGPSIGDRPQLDPALWQEARDSMMLPDNGRSRLGSDNVVDWDSTPTIFEATSVAHGHLLHYKQVWYADGYSLGDLLYSLPLAPGQKKLVSVVDWERRERTERTEFTSAREGLDAIVSRDRDLGEVVNGALTESVRGGSRNTTAGAGVGTGAAGNGSYQGFNFGALLGVSGGYGESDIQAWQVSGRNLSADSLQTLRDKTLQSASAVRSQRASVVQTVSQGESTRVTTEVVANHNHCHALTIQYFEVLRHLWVSHRLVDVRECLFVPLPMAAFDGAKVLRWRDALETYLRRPQLATAFDAVRRVETNWSEVDFPVKRYADEKVVSISGELELTVIIPLPPLPEKPRRRPEDSAEDIADAVAEATKPGVDFFTIAGAILTGGASLGVQAVTSKVQEVTKATIEGARALTEDLMAQPSPQEQYEKFQQEVMPGLVAGFVDQLELYALVRGSEIRIGSADFTLVSEYRPGVPLLASVKATLPPSVSRADIQQVTIKSRNPLPAGCRAIVNTATLRYRTSLFEHSLVDERRANDDIDLPVGQVVPGTTATAPPVVQVVAGQGASVATPLDAWEQRNPRTDDRTLASSLLDHLNEQLEFYHHAVWWTMDPNRRYTLLDGFEAPGAGSRSIASVVENRLIGIVGNSLVLPVAPGVHLDPRIEVKDPRKPTNLITLYATSPLPPARVSLPTRGVFAEAVMGSCNACETVDDSKFWRWEESPIDEPPAIEAATTTTRRAEPPALAPTPFPAPMVAIQNGPAAPDPAGVAAALNALGRQSFADITGVAGTQANAAMAYGKAMDTALAFGKEASTLAQQAAVLGARDRTLAAIDKAEAENKITPDEAKRLRTSTIEKSIGADTGTPKTSEVSEKLGTIRKAQDEGAIGSPAAQRFSESVLKSYVGDDTPTPADERSAAAELIGELDPGSVTRVETTDTGEGSTVVETSGGGSSGGPFGIRGMVADLVTGASPGLTLTPLVAYDRAEPSAEAQQAAEAMAAVDPEQQSQRQDDYIARFGFDTTQPEPLRGASIRQPWLGITVADLDAVIKVATAIGARPENVLAIWIAEGKQPNNAVLHGGTAPVTLFEKLDPATGDADELDPAKVADGPMRAFARSRLLFDVFGLDRLTDFARRPGQDNLLQGTDGRHNVRFDAGIERIRTAGVVGIDDATPKRVRDYFTVVGGGLRVTRRTDKVDVGIRDDSLASWLWLQAASFEVVRRDTETQLFELYGAGAVDLSNRPWVTYLRWNTASDQAGANKIADVLGGGGFANQEQAIDAVFGANPQKLSAVDIERYYSDPQSLSTLANSIVVKYLVESVRGWFA